MLQVIISIGGALVILLLTEILAHKNVVGQELSRKFPHIIAGITIATWSFFVNMQIVVGLGLLFLAAAILVHEFNLFSSARKVDRQSWGELFFPMGVIVAASLNPSKWIFVSAMLHLGVADAAAALIGKTKGRHQNRFFQNKTLEGSIGFIVISALITAWVVLLAPTGLGGNWTAVIWLPFIATIVEAIAPWGLDNLLVPVLIVAVLKLLPAAH